MAEVAAAGEDHGHPMLVAGGDGLIVALRPSGLDQGGHTGFGGDVGAVAEGEEGVGGQDRASMAWAPALVDGDPDRVQPAHLTGSHAD